MIFEITFRQDEVEGFKRVFHADSEATFLDLNNALLQSVNFNDDQITSFFLCDDKWEKQQEITRINMDKGDEYDNLTMEECVLSDYLTDKGQRLLYVFDALSDRAFFGNVSDIKKGKMEGIKCVETKGKAPKQTDIEAEMDALINDAKNIGLDDMDNDFYGDSQYNDDEFDINGFEDLDDLNKY